jgi:hypothetical protein
MSLNKESSGPQKSKKIENQDTLRETRVLSNTKIVGGTAILNIDNSLLEKYGLSKLILEEFGKHKEDLEINFKNQKRPRVVTQILANCIKDNENHIPIDFFWDLPISTRIKCLFLIALSTNNQEIEVELSCSSCLQKMGICLDYGFLNKISEGEETSNIINIRLNDHELTLKKPTGFDQQYLLDNTNKEDKEDTSTFKLVKLLIIQKNEYLTEDILHESINEISSAMDKADPLLNANLSIKCPNCQHFDDYFIDIESKTLKYLQDFQKDLIEEIHTIASHYHWDEYDIIFLPIWRRKVYLSKIKLELNK